MGNIKNFNSVESRIIRAARKNLGFAENDTVADPGAVYQNKDLIDVFTDVYVKKEKLSETDLKRVFDRNRLKDFMESYDEVEIDGITHVVEWIV